MYVCVYIYELAIANEEIIKTNPGKQQKKHIHELL